MTMTMKSIPTPARPAARPVTVGVTVPTTLAEFSRTLPLADITSPGVFAVRVADWVVSPGTTADLDTIRNTEGDVVASILKSKSIPKDHPGRVVLGKAKPALDRTVGPGSVEVFLPGEKRFDNGSVNTAVLVQVRTTLGGKDIHEMRSPLNWLKLLANIDAGGQSLRETVDRCLT
jgi:hypothetical protein